MTQAIGFAPTAFPTARAPFGSPSRLANALYVTVSPGSSSSNARQTCTWKFVPAKRGEQPVAAWVVVPIKFSLKG